MYLANYFTENYGKDELVSSAMMIRQLADTLVVGGGVQMFLPVLALQITACNS